MCDETQKIDFDFAEAEAEENSHVQYGLLRLISGTSDDEPGAVETDDNGYKVYKVFGGETMIGRDPEQCNIVINNKTLSRVHAILDIDDVTFMTIHDNHSLNKTFRNHQQLKPDVHYAIEGGESITLGEVTLKFELSPREEIEKSKKIANTDASVAQSGERNIVPETPAPKAGPSDGQRCDDTFGSFNDSSFIVPSQPLVPSSSSSTPIRNQVADTKSSIFDMETQAFEADHEPTHLDPKKSELFDAETQAFEVNDHTEAVEHSVEQSKDKLSGSDAARNDETGDKTKEKLLLNGNQPTGSGGRLTEVEEEDLFGAETQPYDDNDEESPGKSGNHESETNSLENGSDVNEDIARAAEASDPSISRDNETSKPKEDLDTSMSSSTESEKLLTDVADDTVDEDESYRVPLRSSSPCVPLNNSAGAEAGKNQLLVSEMATQVLQTQSEGLPGRFDIDVELDKTCISPTKGNIQERSVDPGRGDVVDDDTPKVEESIPKELTGGEEQQVPKDALTGVVDFKSEKTEKNTNDKAVRRSDTTKFSVDGESADRDNLPLQTVNDNEELDIIASSQGSGTDRTNFSSKLMELTSSPSRPKKSTSYLSYLADSRERTSTSLKSMELTGEVSGRCRSSERDPSLIIDDGQTVHDNKELDIIASSQGSGTDRTNFSSKLMELTSSPSRVKKSSSYLSSSADSRESTSTSLKSMEITGEVSGICKSSERDPSLIIDDGVGKGSESSHEVTSETKNTSNAVSLERHAKEEAETLGNEPEWKVTNDNKHIQPSDKYLCYKKKIVRRSKGDGRAEPHPGSQIDNCSSNETRESSNADGDARDTVKDHGTSVSVPAIPQNNESEVEGEQAHALETTYPVVVLPSTQELIREIKRGYKKEDADDAEEIEMNSMYDDEDLSSEDETRLVIDEDAMVNKNQRKLKQKSVSPETGGTEKYEHTDEESKPSLSSTPKKQSRPRPRTDTPKPLWMMRSEAFNAVRRSGRQVKPSTRLLENFDALTCNVQRPSSLPKRKMSTRAQAKSAGKHKSGEDTSENSDGPLSTTSQSDVSADATESQELDETNNSEHLLPNASNQLKPEDDCPNPASNDVANAERNDMGENDNLARETGGTTGECSKNVLIEPHQDTEVKQLIVESHQDTEEKQVGLSMKTSKRSTGAAVTSRKSETSTKQRTGVASVQVLDAHSHVTRGIRSLVDSKEDDSAGAQKTDDRETKSLPSEEISKATERIKSESISQPSALKVVADPEDQAVSPKQSASGEKRYTETTQRRSKRRVVQQCLADSNSSAQGRSSVRGELPEQSPKKRPRRNEKDDDNLLCDDASSEEALITAAGPRSMPAHEGEPEKQIRRSTRNLKTEETLTHSPSKTQKRSLAGRDSRFSLDMMMENSVEGSTVPSGSGRRMTRSGISESISRQDASGVAGAVTLVPPIPSPPKRKKGTESKTMIANKKPRADSDSIAPAGKRNLRGYQRSTRNASSDQRRRSPRKTIGSDDANETSEPESRTEKIGQEIATLTVSASVVNDSCLTMASSKGGQLRSAVVVTSKLRNADEDLKNDSLIDRRDSPAASPTRASRNVRHHDIPSRRDDTQKKQPDKVFARVSSKESPRRDFAAKTDSTIEIVSSRSKPNEVRRSARAKQNLSLSQFDEATSNVGGTSAESKPRKSNTRIRSTKKSEKQAVPSLQGARVDQHESRPPPIKRVKETRQSKSQNLVGQNLEGKTKATIEKRISPNDKDKSSKQNQWRRTNEGKVENSLISESPRPLRRSTRSNQSPPSKQDFVLARRDSTSSVNSTVSSVASSNTSTSSGRKKAKPVVMFTGVDSPQERKVVADLGGFVTESLSECSVLVTDRVRRTAKFLCMAAKGIPIVSNTWIDASKDVKSFQDPWLHIVEDEESERKWGFNLKTSLRGAAKSPLLSGYRVYATKSVTPPPAQLKEIVEFAGGHWLKTPPRRPSDDVIIISCQEDKKAAKTLKNHGFHIHDKEILLTGILRREFDLKSHLLHL